MKNSTKGRLLTAFLIFLVFLLFTILFRRHLREGGPLQNALVFLDTSVPYPYVDTTYATQSKPSDETTYTLDATPTKASDETTYTFPEVTGEITTPSAVNAHTTLPDKVTSDETTYTFPEVTGEITYTFPEKVTTGETKKTLQSLQFVGGGDGDIDQSLSFDAFAPVAETSKNATNKMSETATKPKGSPSKSRSSGYATRPSSEDGTTTCSDDPHWVMTGRKGKTRRCDWVKKNKHQRCGYHTNKKTLQTRLLPRIGTGGVQSDVACAKACGTC